VVLAALAASCVLAAIVAPVIEDKVAESRSAVAADALTALSRRMHAHFEATGRWETVEARGGVFREESFELAERDPWGRPVLALHLADGPGSILLVSRGADGELDSPNAELAAGRTRGDDLLQAITHRVAAANLPLRPQGRPQGRP